MRYLLTLCFFLFLIVASRNTVHAQHSCCTSAKKPAKEAGEKHCAGEKEVSTIQTGQTSVTNQFASLAGDASFAAGHEEPLAYTHQTTTGKEISYPTPDGQTARAFAYMTAKKSSKYLLVFHEWWGLNDHIKRQAERYYKELGVNVLALDLYDGKIASTREEAQQYVRNVDEARAKAIIEGALTLAGKDAKIATLGWCFGGGWSLQAAILAGKQAEACVVYYGMPEQDVQKLQKLQCEVLGIFASKDGHITPAVVETFKENMEKADKELDVRMYDAQHAFANPSNPAYDKGAAESAHKVTLNFLKKHLK